MKSAALFLLLCLSPFVSQGLSEVSVPQEDDVRPGVEGPRELPVLWDELWGLRDLVLSLKAEEVERRQALRSLESRLRDREVEAEQQRQSLDGLQETVVHQQEELKSGEQGTELISDLRRRVEETGELSKALAVQVWTLQSDLNASESSVEHLKKKSAAMASELPFLQTRLRANERTVEQLRRKNAVLAARLCSTESVMEELRRQVSGFPASNSSETRLNSTSEGTTNSSAVEENLSSVTSRLLQLEKRDKEQTSKLMEVQRRVDLEEELLDRLKTEVLNRLRVSERQLEELKTEDTAQSVQLSWTESRLTGHDNSSADMMDRQTVSERQLKDLKTENTGLDVRVSAGEKQLQELKTENTDVMNRLRVAEKQLLDLRSEQTGLEVRVSDGEKQLQGLRTENTGGLKVAFSAGLTDSGPVGPFDEEKTLIFSKTISNIGRGYDQITGVFTAPVRGVYFFSFTAADYLKGYMGLYLYRNNQPILFHLDLNDHGGYTSTSSSVALQLEEGDRVRLSLPASYRLYDDPRNFSIFSGFLLFPL